MIAVRAAALGHFSLSWRSDDHRSYLGKPEANKRSGLNPIKVWRTLLFSMSLGYWRVPMNLLLRLTVTHPWPRRRALVNVPGACVYRLRRSAGQATQPLFPYGRWCLELENFTLYETKPSHSTSTKLCFEKECEKLGLLSSCCGPCFHFQKEELCSRAVLTWTLWISTQARNACGQHLMGCQLLRWDCRDRVTCNNLMCWLVKL